MPQTVLGATCSFSCHPENYHQDVHYHPASADGDLPNQGPLQEVQGQCGAQRYHLFLFKKDKTILQKF